MKFRPEKPDKTQSEFECCVLCGAKTKVLKSTPVQARSDYIEGAGQLCARCAAELRGEDLYASQSGYVYELPYYEKTRAYR